MPLTTVNPAMIGQTSTGAASLTATGSAAASLVTAAGTALSADSSGQVITPYQVAFHVRVNNANYVTTSPVPFSNAVFNVGNAFNTSTYTFTAPVAGRYMFLLQWYTRLQNNNTGSSIRLVVNSSQVAYSDVTITTGATLYQTIPMISVLNLSVGDSVYYTYSGSVGSAYYGGNQETNLFGYLLG